MNPTIGLEIHAELKTATKMFCGCANNPEEKHPNINVCPICLGHPGTLPTINKDAVFAVLRTGLALGGTPRMQSHFDRKSYFYPDLPKGYQISQYEEPLIEGGKLHNVRIRRIHLEEDTGRLLHELPNHKTEDASFVDFNRAGVPLMELVTEPDITSAEEAVLFAKELQLILRYLGVSYADMERGQMRIEANISLDMGTKVEVKNINSFKAVEGAIRYELERQKDVLERGEKVHQETRGWNDAKGKTESQRSKESAHDYRYFPEPDLPPLTFTEAEIEALRADIPELPEAKRERFKREYGLTDEQAFSAISDKGFAERFEEAASEYKVRAPKGNYAVLYNIVGTVVAGVLNEKKTTAEEAGIKPEHLGHLAALFANGEISNLILKEVLLKMIETGEDPETIMREGNIRLVTDRGELEEKIRGVLKEHMSAVLDYKNGKEEALQFLFGRVMGAMKGQADPKTLRELLEKNLK